MSKTDKQPTPTRTRTRSGFNGPREDDQPAREIRLTGQIGRVYDALRGVLWITLADLASHTGDPEASVSAQIRHLRKPRFGEHTILKKHKGKGAYLYRLVIPK